MDITFCILTFNSAATIKAVLQRIMLQNIVDPNILIYDNGSKDGTVEMIQAIIKNNWFMGAKIELIDDIHLDGGTMRNIVHGRYMVSQRVKTKYMMFIDSDVLIPQFSVRRVFSEIEKPENGMMAIRYSPNANHVQLGATMLRTKHAKNSKWQYNPKCECSHLKDELEENNLTVKYHDGFQATHLGLFL